MSDQVTDRMQRRLLCILICKLESVFTDETKTSSDFVFPSHVHDGINSICLSPFTRKPNTKITVKRHVL